MPQDTAPVAGEAQAATKTILLVEDDVALGSVLLEVLAQETPYQAILATDSHAALQLVRHCTPDLLILDYGLPDLNGIDLYDRLHTNEALAALPAILMTANRYVPQQQLHQRQLIFFRKPFELDALLATIETLLTAP